MNAKELKERGFKFFKLPVTLLNPLPVLIILLSPLPVLVALKILRDILSFTRSFMINTRPFAGSLENSDRKVKQFRVIPHRLVYRSSICNCIEKLSRNRHRANRTAFKSSSVINLVYSYKANQTRFDSTVLVILPAWAVFSPSLYLPSQILPIYQRLISRRTVNKTS